MIPYFLPLVNEDVPEAAIAKIMPKKKSTATATASNIVVIFMVTCCMAGKNLTLPLANSG